MNPAPAEGAGSALQLRYRDEALPVQIEQILNQIGVVPLKPRKKPTTHRKGFWSDPVAQPGEF